ncbi:MAG: hypothetical protein ACJ761_08950 [Chloroflexota bacterium]
MRPSKLVVGTALTAALALVALPGLAGSRTPSPIEPLPRDVFQPLRVPAIPTPMGMAIEFDATHRSAGAVTAESRFIEPGVVADPAPDARPATNQPAAGATSARKPPRQVLRGQATFYDNGTTAMRIPRGTTVVICGGGGCIERVVNDYGPQKPSRVVDLFRPDFFQVCGCPSFSGVTMVTVYVY